MRYTGVLLLLTALCFVSCTGKKDFKDGIVQLQSRPVSLSLDKMRCMWNGKDTLNIEEMYGLSLFHDKGLTEESNHVVFFHKLK